MYIYFPVHHLSIIIYSFFLLDRLFLATPAFCAFKMAHVRRTAGSTRSCLYEAEVIVFLAKALAGLLPPFDFLMETTTPLPSAAASIPTVLISISIVFEGILSS